MRWLWRFFSRIVAAHDERWRRAHTDAKGRRITVNPEVCGGRPCIRGMRIRVSDVLDMLAAGASRAEILASYSYLEDEDITATLTFALAQPAKAELR